MLDYFLVNIARSSLQESKSSTVRTVFDCTGRTRDVHVRTVFDCTIRTRDVPVWSKIVITSRTRERTAKVRHRNVPFVPWYNRETYRESRKRAVVIRSGTTRRTRGARFSSRDNGSVKFVFRSVSLGSASKFYTVYEKLFIVSLKFHSYVYAIKGYEVPS